jgi:hypothetical protein
MLLPGRSATAERGGDTLATIRHHTRIARSADDVWILVSDPDIGGWFPGVDSCTIDGDVRTIGTMGIEVQEQVVTTDDNLRRFQYSIIGGAMVPEHHIATIDVIEDGDESILIYSCDVKPDEAGALLGPVLEQATAAIKNELES